MLDRARIAVAAMLLGVGSPGAGAALARPIVEPDAFALRMRACTPCHGPQGRATPDGYFPRIAGKPSGYLLNQLLHFRDARRSSPAMNELTRHMGDDYLAQIAQWFASQAVPHPPPATAPPAPDQSARGRQLVMQGDPARGIAACSACHGSRLTGVQPAYPGLLGLPRDYIAAQIGAWKSGQRRAFAPDCMADIAQRLTQEDVGAVASWLAAQQVPSDGAPERALPAPAPARCGGVDPAR